MSKLPKIFSSDHSPRQRRAYRLTTAFFVTLFISLIWPIYPLFAGIEPRIFGVPFSLAYVVTLVLLSFGVLFALFRWEERRAPPPGAPDEEA